jgi:hypothetical protein
LFVAAALYHNRAKYPLILALVLALLANANLFSIILVGLIAALWAWDIITQQRREAVPIHRSSLYLPLLIIIGGVLLSLAFT